LQVRRLGRQTQPFTARQAALPAPGRGRLGESRRPLVPDPAAGEFAD
jgi:hypothetical protein